MHILVTVKDNKNRFISIKELEMTLEYIRKHGEGWEWSDNVGYELDTRRCLHAHTLFKSPNNISVKKWTEWLSKVTGLHVHFQPYKKDDDSKIRRYINKERVPKEILENDSRQYFLTRKNMFNI